MAAGPWKVFPYGKLRLGAGDINLSTDVFNLTIHKIGASANLLTTVVSEWASIGSECTGGGYTAGGNTLSSNTWTLSGNNGKFDSSDWVVTGTITSIKYAVIMRSVNAASGWPLCYCTLSANAFDLTGSNTMTIQMNASGIFTLA